MSVRKNGARGRAWRVTCPACPTERVHFTDLGVVVVNDRGIGNRTWELARLAVAAHLRQHSAEVFDGTPSEMLGVPDPADDARYQKTLDLIEEAERG